MNKNYNKIFLHNIYAIIEPDIDVVYVAKTTIKNPYRKRRDVINGKISSVDGEFSDKCKFLLLESIHISKPDAFSHVLAWYRFFENNGYDVLAIKKAAHMLEFPKKKTEKIYNEVCLPYSVEEGLERKVLPLKRIEKNKEPQKEQYPFTQLNIRVRENIAESFQSVSRNFGLSQNDTLKLLLSEKDDAIKISLADELCTLKQKIHTYKKLLQEQSKKNRDDKAHSLRRQKETMEILKNSINLLVTLLEDVHMEKMQPQRIKKEQGKKLFHSYSYPETSGCCLAKLEEIVLGNYHTSQLGKVTVTKFLLFNTLSDKK